MSGVKSFKEHINYSKNMEDNHMPPSDPDLYGWRQVSNKRKQKILVKGNNTNIGNSNNTININTDTNTNKKESMLAKTQSTSYDKKNKKVDFSVLLAADDNNETKPVHDGNIIDPKKIDKNVVALVENELQVNKSVVSYESIDIMEQTEKNITINSHDNDKGVNLKLKHSWNIYVHKAEGVDWTIDSFDKEVFVIDSVGTALQFIENLYKLNSKQYNFFIMKSLDDNDNNDNNDIKFIEPTWEHEQNRNGGICSIRIDSLHGVELLQQLFILMINECLIPNSNIINGLSYGVKTNWALIKIWTNDKVEDISKLLPNAIVGSYNNINIRYRQNVPEY